MKMRSAILVGVAILFAAEPSLAQRGRPRASSHSAPAPATSAPATAAPSTAVMTPAPVATGSFFVDGEALPPAKPAADGGCVMALAGSVWEGSTVWKGGEKVNWWVQFRGDGVMVYAYRGSTYDNGRWRQDGTTVSFDTNNHYADYSGTATVTGAAGSSKNQVGDSGEWRLKRDC